MAILYNIKKVVLTELDDSTGTAKSGGVVSHIKTAQKAELEPVLSEGDEGKPKKKGKKKGGR